MPMTRYALMDLELQDPTPVLEVPLGYQGLAVVFRRGGRVVGFELEALLPGGSPEIRSRASQAARRGLLTALQEDIRRELAPQSARPANPSVTVVICTHNQTERLARCLASLERMEQPAGAGRPEILVVDNAPPNDATECLVRLSAGVRYVQELRQGLDFARNRAIAEATGEILAFLDDDVVADRFWYQALLEAIAQAPGAGAVTGSLLPFELETTAQVLFERRGGFRRGFEYRCYAGQDLPGNPLYPCGAGIFGTGGNMAFRRSVLQELGGFDEALDTGRPLAGGGDLDMFYRVIRAGHPLVYDPSVVGFHQHRRTRAQLRRQYWTWGTGFMAYARKSYLADPPMRSRWRRMVIWWFKDQVRSLLHSVIGRNPTPPGMVLAELAGGVIGIAGEYERSLRRVQRIREAVS